jgi:hypothetical protein
MPAPQPGATVLPGGTAAPAAPPVPEPPLPAVKISAKVDRVEVQRDDTVSLIITLEYERPASDDTAPLDFEFPDPPKADGLTLFANSLEAATELEGGNTRVRRDYTYQFRADKEGPTRIGAVAVKYFRIGSMNKASLATLEIPVTVTKPRLKLGALAKNPVAIVVLGLIILAAAVALLWSPLKSRWKRPVGAAPVRSVYELARDRLREADRLRMAGDYDRFLGAVLRELDRFIGEVLGVKARPGTAERIEAVAKLLGEEWRGRLTELQRFADQVKFAGREPSGPEMDQAMAAAKLIVDEAERGLAGNQVPSPSGNTKGE